MGKSAPDNDSLLNATQILLSKDYSFDYNGQGLIALPRAAIWQNKRFTLYAMLHTPFEFAIHNEVWRLWRKIDGIAEEMVEKKDNLSLFVDFTYFYLLFFFFFLSIFSFFMNTKQTNNQMQIFENHRQRKSQTTRQPQCYPWCHQSTINIWHPKRIETTVATAAASQPALDMWMPMAQSAMARHNTELNWLSKRQSKTCAAVSFDIMIYNRYWMRICSVRCKMILW